jgi:hypothetical protein
MVGALGGELINGLIGWTILEVTGGRTGDLPRFWFFIGDAVLCGTWGGATVAFFY